MLDLEPRQSLVLGVARASLELKLKISGLRFCVRIDDCETGDSFR